MCVRLKIVIQFFVAIFIASSAFALAEGIKPTITVGQKTQTSIQISWDLTDPTFVVDRYEISKGSYTYDPTPQSPQTFSGLTPSTAYKFTVTAFDAAGNKRSSYQITSTLNEPEPIVPTAPTNLVVSQKTQYTAVIGWSASSDNVGIKRYEVLVNGVGFGRPTGTYLLLKGLSPSTNYTVAVKAVDRSELSSPWTETKFTTESGLPTNGQTTQYRHNDLITITGSFGTNDVTKTFLGGSGGLIESKTVGQSVADAGSWTFNEPSAPTSIAGDGIRGKVLYTSTATTTSKNAIRRFDMGWEIPEQRYFYKAHYARDVFLIAGTPYEFSYQWKHERISWTSGVVDSDPEIRFFDWNNGIHPVSYIPQVYVVSANTTDAKAAQSGASNAAGGNSDWSLIEILGYTGTQGVTDGKVIVRVHKNGKTWIIKNLQPHLVYGTTKRFRYFIEQNYHGNWAQGEEGESNNTLRPDVQQIYTDDSNVVVGNTANTGWKRVELRDSLDLRTATVREIQNWQTWNGNISLKLNTGGLVRGLHNMYLVVIDGVDAEGWDRVIGSMPIAVQVN